MNAVELIWVGVGDPCTAGEIATLFDVHFLKVFLSVVKSELCAFHLEHFSQLGRSAEEDGHFSFSLG